MKMTCDNPLVTIYLPTFNRVDLLQRAVDSVFNQTYKNIELIIVDDCSTDGTIDYLQNLAAQHSQVKIHLKQQNSGACVSRNIAIDMAQGEYITGLDDDDYFLPDRIESFITHADKLKKHVFLSAKSYQLGASGKLRKAFSSRLIQGGRHAYSDIVPSNLVGNQIFVPAKKLKQQHFDPSLPMWQDYELWLRLLRPDESFYIMNKYTYVVDTCHTLARISDNKSSAMLYAWNLIAEKNQFNEQQKKMLAINFAAYGYAFPFRGTLYMVRLCCSIFSLYYFFRLNLVERWRCKKLNL